MMKLNDNLRASNAELERTFALNARVALGLCMALGGSACTASTETLPDETAQKLGAGTDNDGHCVDGWYELDTKDTDYASVTKAQAFLTYTTPEQSNKRVELATLSVTCKPGAEPLVFTNSDDRPTIWKHGPDLQEDVIRVRSGAGYDECATPDFTHIRTPGELPSCLPANGAAPASEPSKPTCSSSSSSAACSPSDTGI